MNSLKVIFDSDTWQEILHEVAHWLVATKEERLEPNIGFPDDHGYIEDVDSDRFDIYDDDGKQIYGGHL